MVIVFEAFPWLLTRIKCLTKRILNFKTNRKMPILGHFFIIEIFIIEIYINSVKTKDKKSR